MSRLYTLCLIIVIVPIGWTSATTGAITPDTTLDPLPEADGRLEALLLLTDTIPTSLSLSESSELRSDNYTIIQNKTIAMEINILDWDFVRKIQNLQNSKSLTRVYTIFPATN